MIDRWAGRLNFFHLSISVGNFCLKFRREGSVIHFEDAKQKVFFCVAIWANLFVRRIRL